MDLRETAEQQQLRQELRDDFAELLPPEGQALDDARAVRSPPPRLPQMGADGWLGVGWPVEYGGQGRPLEDQFVFFDEVQRAGAPFPFVTVNTVGPTLMQYGSEEQKDTYLPGILNGEINFAIGYTEPEAGTDLATLRTRAVRDGDEWVIDGNKMFTSGADRADFVWLACRTDPEAPKHKGISIILVPTSPRVLRHPDPHGRRDGHHRHLLRRHPGAGRQRRRRGERRLAADHQPAQPRAGRAGRPRRPGDVALGAGARLGQGHRHDRPAVGAAGPGPMPRPARGHAAAQLEDGGGGRGGHPPAAERRPAKVYGTESQVEVYRAARVLGPRARSAPAHRAPCSAASSNGGPAGSTPSAAGSTRSSATSWPTRFGTTRSAR